MPCPLCLLGYTEEEHSKELWATIGDNNHPNYERLNVILAARRKETRAAEIAAGLPPGSIIG